MDDGWSLTDTAELDRYERGVADYLAGRLSEEDFTALRLQQGIYGQRQEDVQMVRIKLPGGRLYRHQLATLADLCDEYSPLEFVSLTTRQDVQMHFVPLAQTPALLKRLADSGLTTREACGNTVRNITACPLAGVCPREHVDVMPVVRRLAGHFLRHPMTQHLPRKFKVSVSGCEADCAQGLIHDVAVIASQREGRHGFRVLVGGGLGHKPREAMVLEEFLPEQDLLACVEALLIVHHLHSDRHKRARSRLKFLLDRFGPDGFRQQYRQQFARVHKALSIRQDETLPWLTARDSEACGPGAPRAIVAQRQAGHYAVPAFLPLGDVNVAQLRHLSDLMESCSLNELRTTQDQNLVLVNVPEVALPRVQGTLADLAMVADEDVVACPGSWTCRLGITSSRELARRLNQIDPDLRIRVSGCHNGCAHPYVADIGLHGHGRRLHGKLVPFYRLYFGGDGTAGGGLAMVGPDLPALRVEPALRYLVANFRVDKTPAEDFSGWAQRKGRAFFTELLEEYHIVTADDLPALLRDVGEAVNFKVAQLGGGECAGIKQEEAAALLAQARQEQNYGRVFINQRMYADAMTCAENILRLGAQLLLTHHGRGFHWRLTDLLSSLQQDLPNAERAVEEFESLLAALQDLREDFDQDYCVALFQYACQWLEQQVLIDEAPAATTRPREAELTLAQLDLTNISPPLDFFKAKQVLGELDLGRMLQLKSRRGQSTELLRGGLAAVGYRVIDYGDSVASPIATTLVVKTRVEAGAMVPEEISAD